MKTFKIIFISFVLIYLTFIQSCSDNTVQFNKNEEYTQNTDEIEGCVTCWLTIFAQKYETPYPNPPNPLPHATVNVYNPSWVLTFSGTTDINGYETFNWYGLGLDSGLWHVYVYDEYWLGIEHIEWDGNSNKYVQVICDAWDEDE